ncbi:MAG: type II secretion system protein GspL [bacterium]
MTVLRSLFFPSHLKGKPLFALQKVAIHIEQTMVQVAHIKDTRSTSIITSLEEYQINPGDNRTYTQRLTATLKKIAPKIEKNAEVIVTFPSSKVVIKELTLPFLDAEKIRMVIEYEIEAIIPFKLDNALIDFIIISQSEVKESSTILVVAAQKEEVKRVLDQLAKADIQAHSITLDLFSSLSLFNQLPAYNKLKHAYALIDIGPQSTRMILINNQVMVATRTLTKGSDTPLKHTDEIEVSIDTTDHLAKLFAEIAFTLNSFEIKQVKGGDIEKLFCISSPEVYEKFEQYAVKSIHIPCETLATEQIMSNPAIQSTVTLPPQTWQTYSRVLGAALLKPLFESFTLRRKELEISPLPYITRNLITAGSIIFCICALLGAHIYFQIQEEMDLIMTLENKEMKRLRSALPSDSPGAKKRNLKALAKEVETHIQEQEEIWSTFAAQRLRPLEILQELTALFNKKKFDIDIEHIHIGGDSPQQNPIEVKGVFRSKTSPGKADFKHFSELATDISTSKTLMLTEEIDPTQLPEKGVSFVARFTVREESE